MPGSPAGLRRGVLRGGGILCRRQQQGIQMEWHGLSTITPPYSGSFTKCGSKSE